ncbi:hypothetical protein Cyast_2812 [Cyanobacterium stanieri PCC 7202]|uniref:Uncharacterized protein n=1 Tax=Cyanobacterium stanieri (strain ATCC 29140 / PCC 7202) TaxID=292563 RepID=K9YPG1_CYASC|nr:hypothetical protein Cyast_2812 [Cyanobacterium stanieri PCC 7202]
MTKGTLGILLAGFYAGYLGKQETLDLVQKLVNNSIRLSAYVIHSIKTELDQYDFSLRKRTGNGE